MQTIRLAEATSSSAYFRVIPRDSAHKTHRAILREARRPSGSRVALKRGISRKTRMDRGRPHVAAEAAKDQGARSSRCPPRSQRCNVLFELSA